MSNIVIKAENIGKYYRLGQINTGMFYSDLRACLQRKLRRTDDVLRNDDYGNDKKGFWALEDINFEIERGEKVGIIGKNGAGKSTLLKIISQVTVPTKGRIGIKGSLSSLLEVGTGFHPEMTGRENIYLNGAILGMKRTEINNKIKDIIEFSEIDDHIDTPVKRYSSGMYVRLAFAVAAFLDSDILLADEVLAVGDAAFQKKALGRMNELSERQGRTVLFVSHQMNAVKALCSKGMVLDRGKIVFTDNIDHCISFYQKDLFQRQTVSDLSRYNNEFFELLDYKLADENGNPLLQPLENNKRSYVHIELNMKKLRDDYTIGYSLRSAEGEVVYWSYLSDANEKDHNVTLGKNVLIGEIPNHFLNEGEYYIYFSASIHFIQWIVNPDEDSPCLRLAIQGGLSESPFWTLRRSGICAPILKWRLEH